MSYFKHESAYVGAGKKLKFRADGTALCDTCGRKYRLTDGTVAEID